MKFRLLILCFFSCLLIYNSKKYDIFLTSLFYQNNHFYLKDNIFVTAVDKYAEYLVCVLYACSLGIFFLNKSRFFNILPVKFQFIDEKKALFLSVCFLGWCIAIPCIFKIIFLRARPYQTDIFGGQCHFSEAFIKSSCNIGDSFISGHTSLAMWLFALTLIMPKKIKIKCFIFALITVLSVATGRILGGYHFITDVYFSCLLVGGGIYITWKKCILKKN